MSTSKMRLKPRVDQFEYLNQIKKYHSKEYSRTKSHRNMLKNKMDRNNEINSSFRNSSSNPKSSLLIDSKVKQVYDDEHNFLFSCRTNQRSQAEIKKYICKKREDRLKQEEEKEVEKNQKLFTTFKNLYNLNKEDLNRKTMRNNNTNSSKSIRKTRVKNDYYVGTLKTESTLLDPNEYYFSIISSQQLWLGAPQSVQESENEKEEENQSRNNSLIVSPDLVRKITQEESEKHSSSLSNLEQLKAKVNNTLSKANNWYEGKNIENIIKTKDSNSDDKENKSNNHSHNKSQSPRNKQNKSSSKSMNKSQSQESFTPSGGDDIKRKLITSTKEKEKEKEKENKKILLEIPTTSDNNTKEKNIPSLSHTYTSNTNPNKKIEIEIEPRAVLNLVEIIKLLMQRRTFYNLYEIYINEALCQRYTIAFAYFTAWVKQYPFNRIKDHCNYKSYHYAFSQLFRPFIRKNFEFFVGKCYFGKKVEYLVELWDHVVKIKSLEKIFIYGQHRTHDIESQAFYNILIRIVKVSIKPSMKTAFELFKINAMKCWNKNQIVLKKEVKPLKEIKGRYDKSESNSIEFEERSERKWIPDSSIKMNTFMYETYSEKSEYTLEPNSVDSDRLHRWNELISEKERFYLQEHGGYVNDNWDNSEYSEKHARSVTSNHSKKSNKSSKSLKDLLKEKPGIDLRKKSHNSDKSLSFNSEDGDHKLRKSLSNKSLNSLKKSWSNKSLGSASKHSKNSNASSPNKSMDKEKDYVNNIKETKKKESIYNNIDDNEVKDIKVDETIEEVINENYNCNKTPTNNMCSEQDVSAEKDPNANIDWEYSVSNSKSIPNADKDSNDKKEVQKPSTVLTQENREQKEIKKKLEKNNEIKDEFEVEEIIEIEINEENVKKEEKPISKNPEQKTIDKIDEKEESYEDFEKENWSGLEDDDNTNIVSIIQGENKQNEKSRNNAALLNNKDEANINPNQNEQKSDEQLKPKTKSDESNKTDQVSLKSDDKKDIQQKNFPSLSISNEDFANLITEEWFKQIFDSEIKAQKIVPSKRLKFDGPNPNVTRSNSLTNSNPAPIQNNPLLSNQGNSIFGNISSSLNDSMLSNYSALSYFNQTVKDHKKENSRNWYTSKIGPKWIQCICNEIRNNYKDIYDNLSTPMKNNPKQLMISLALQDADMLRENYKGIQLEKEINQIIKKDKILKEFESLNKKIRNKDNVTSDNFYDNILNQCWIDSAIELLSKERLYDDAGEPLPWSSRTRELEFKYDKTNPNLLVKHIENSLLDMLRNKIGWINDNYEFLSSDQINMERERRWIKEINNDLVENEPQWTNLEMEETQLKVEVTESIWDQLYNEGIEILEHIQYSRKRPDLYQYKSIYACEEIPKLTFQMTTSDENDDEDNEIVNI